MDTKKLRQKLLDLAIHGKLVPQDPNDEPASELLSRIHAEKLAMVERGELKPKDVKNDTVIYFGSDGLPYEKRADGKGEAKCVADEIPFDLPRGWRWARVSDHYLFSNGTSKRSGKEGISTPVLRLADLDEATIALDGVRAVVLTETERNKYDLKPNDLLFIRVNGSRTRVGSCFVVPSLNEHYAFCDHLIRGKSVTSISSQFIATVMGVNFIRETIDAGIVCAAGQNTISQSVLKSIIVPIPPLPEQHRIVGALGKYLALVDGIERDRTDLDGLLAQLKSKVLDLAVRGELVEHDPGDEPSSELLSRIHEEKLAMVGRGELKPKDVKGDTVIFAGSDGLRYEKPADGKGEAKCIEVEIPFEIPEGWSWARLGQLVATCGGKTPSKANKEFWEGGGVPWITSKDMKAPELFGSQIELTESGAAETNIVPAGSVLMVVRSGILRRLLPVAINRVETTINQDLKAMTPYDPRLSDWLLTCFNAWDKRIRDIYHKDGTTVDSIEFDAMLSMLLPVPPLAEQRHIVEAIKTAFNFTNL